jgi:3-methyladenine DNA glycosylase AlkC
MEPLKLFFSASLVRAIGQSLKAAWSPFPLEAFVSDAAAALPELELMDRGRAIARAMQRHLPADYREAAAILVDSLGAKHATDELLGSGMAGFYYLPHVMFVSEFGLDHFELSLQVQYQLTQRFTCEFSIRPYLERYPEQTLAKLAEWVTDPNAHVRRLVSEGTRQRLPWAPRVKLLDEEPERVLRIVSELRDDASPMVRRSVANHLNDLGKSHAPLLMKTCREWLKGASPERHKLVQHALRSAVKRGDKQALALLGHGAAPAVRVQGSFSPKAASIGSKVRVTVALTSTARKTQSLNVDLAVVFTTVGGTSRRVFKLKRIELAAGETAELSKLISLAVHTTRKPAPGRYPVEVMVNGVGFEVGGFGVKG